MDSIPFHFDAVHGGFSNCAGLLHVEEGGLRFEYRYDVGGIGLKTGTRESAIGIDDIASIDFKRGWFGARAILRPRSLKTLEKLPVATDDSAVIHFRRRDRKRADYLISEVNLAVSQRRPVAERVLLAVLAQRGLAPASLVVSRFDARGRHNETHDG